MLSSSYLAITKKNRYILVIGKPWLVYIIRELFYATKVPIKKKCYNPIPFCVRSSSDHTLPDTAREIRWINGKTNNI